MKVGALVYVKYWFEAPMATNAGWEDLSLWKDMTNFEVIGPQISEGVKNAIKSDLWYISDELVGLRLFSEKVLYQMRQRWKLSRRYSVSLRLG